LDGNLSYLCRVGFLRSAEITE